MKVTHLPESHCWWQNTSRILWQKNLKRSFRTPFVWFPLYLSMYRFIQCRVSGVFPVFQDQRKKTIDSNHPNPLDETSTRWGFVTRLFDRPRTSNLTLAPTCCALAKAGHQEIRDIGRKWMGPRQVMSFFWVNLELSKVFFSFQEIDVEKLNARHGLYIHPNGLCTYMCVCSNI